MTGFIQGQDQAIDFEPGDDEKPVAPKGEQDIFVARYTLLQPISQFNPVILLENKLQGQLTLFQHLQ